MSKYIKLDDAIDAVMNTEAVFADVTAEPYQKTRDVTQALHNLPTTEVSDDCISREWVKGICEAMLDEEMLGYMLGHIEDAPSVVPKPQNADGIKEYILSELADLLDEYSELDEHGLHDPKWCGVNEAYLIVKNASSKQKEGEWIVKQSGFAECSVCEQQYFSDYNYCPNCGADMRGEAE